MNASVAGAPVSFGVFELTPEGMETLTADDVLDILAETGYAGVDLGPVGFLGRGDVLRERLGGHGLELAGGWVQLPFADDEAYEASLPELHEALAVFGEATAAGAGRMPLPTLADAGSAARRARPGAGHEVDPVAEDAWDRIAANLEHAASLVRAAGFEPTFHHHAGTFVESPEEIERLLERVDVDLTLDIGHLALGGGDPLETARRWGTRINHLHVKDISERILRDVVAVGGGMPEVWSSGAFTALGRGDLDIAAVMTAMESAGFDGWIVVEQDILTGPDVRLETFRGERAADHRINREALRPWA